MAPSLVQQANAVQSFGGGPTVITPGSETGDGSLLVLAGMTNSNTATATVTDSADNEWIIGNTVTEADNPPAGANTSAEGYAFIAWVFGAAPVTSVSLNVSGQSYAADLTLSEWTGLASFASGGGADGASGGDAAISTPALTLATAEDVVVTACYIQFDDTSVPVTPLAAFSSDSKGLTAWGQPAASGSFTPQASNAGQRNWAMAAAAFTPPAADPPAPGGGQADYALRVAILRRRRQGN